MGFLNPVLGFDSLWGHSKLVSVLRIAYLCWMTDKEYKQEHYRRNKQRYLDQTAASKRKLRQWLQDYKATLKCSKCGEDHPACIEFHHRDPATKSFTIGEAVGRHSKDKIINEINKCDVLCANCHRKLHHQV